MGKEQNTFDIYSPPKITLERGDGCWLYDTNGDAYLDCTSGIAVNALGHNHPYLVNTLKAAAEDIWHLSNLFEIPGQAKLAGRLCENTFADRVFFTNSGAEAMECAIKTARKYHHHNGNPERVEIITFEGAFHGRTTTTVAAGGQEKYLEGFGPRSPGFISVPFGDHDALKAAVSEKTAAIMVEPVQGEGGVRAVPAQCLQGLRDLCDEHGILLVFDEVQTGVGRCGALFAHQLHGVEPDIMGIAKGIGGGFPVGACLATDDAAAGMTLGTHGSTFGGNPLAMAIGNAVLDVVLEDGFIDSVKQRATYFRQMLAELLDTYSDLLEDIRGEGLLIGVKAKISNLDIVAAMRDEKKLVVAAGDNVIRILPPLIMGEEDIRAARSKMIAALDSVRSAKQAA